MRTPHLSDVLLQRALDGALDMRQIEEVAAHLAECPACRDRSLALAKGALAVPVSPAGGVFARVRQRLAALADEPAQLPLLVSAAAGAAVAVAAVILLLFGSHSASTSALPNTRHTPGAVQLTTREAVCGLHADEGAQRRLAPELAARVFAAYGIQPQPGAYEVDFLISPALGGAEDFRNLWPQPYDAGEWNAHAKDALETHLHQLVCAGQLDLAAAQQEIARNWVAAYRRHFRTQRPLPAHLAFQKDRAWK